MFKKKNPVVLALVGVAAATAIGLAGVKLTPAPHVLLSLSAASAESAPEATALPTGSVFAGAALRVVDFADPEAEAYEPLLDSDSIPLSERFALPELERINAADTQTLIEPIQVMQRIRALGIDPDSFETPEANWKNLYNAVMTELAPLTATPESAAVFSGASLSELNDFLSAARGAVTVESGTLLMDETLTVPSGVRLDGGGVRLTAGETALDKAIVLDGAQDTAVIGFVIDGGCDYGIYVKNSTRFSLSDNEISNCTLKPICVMGNNSDFAVCRNTMYGNQNGGMFLDGEISDGVIEDNRIVGTLGTRNLTAGLVLCAVPLEDIETAYNPFQDELLQDILEAPHRLVVRGNTISQNQSSGIYSHAGYLNYFVGNTLQDNEKEGLCLDYGSFGNYVSGCSICRNGGRGRMTDADLEADFVLEVGRLADGSSPAKLPGISLDNAAFNTLYGNSIRDNYGSGIKAVRTVLCSTILCNEILDNNRGVSDLYHFFGVELSTDLNADEETLGLDMAPCYENILARNVVSGAHYAGIFMGEDAYANDLFDNIIMGCTDWSIESLSGRFNSVLNNVTAQASRGLDG